MKMSGLASALASLTATYTDSEDEDTTQEEEDHNKDVQATSNPASPVVIPEPDVMLDTKSSSSAAVGNDVIKGNSTSASGLVSYIDDQIDDDAVDDYQSDSVSEKDDELRSRAVTSGDDDSKSPDVVALSKGGGGEDNIIIEEDDEPMIVEEVDIRKSKLPPEPTGQVKPVLQERVATLYAKKVKDGLDFNEYIQQKKQFRNPSIYEKLITHCNIDELGTNYPPDVYNPHEWAESSFFDELAKVQKADMERREKEKKERTKVEFISGTVKKSSGGVVANVGPVGLAAGMAGPGAVRLASKWDQRGSIASLPLSYSTNQPILVQPNLATAATGTKTTVINAFGNLPKKSKQ